MLYQVIRDRNYARNPRPFFDETADWGYATQTRTDRGRRCGVGSRRDRDRRVASTDRRRRHRVNAGRRRARRQGRSRRTDGAVRLRVKL